MAFDKVLAERIRTAIGAQEGLEEKTMFGGVGFLVHGNLACGVHKDEMIVRVGPEKYKEALEQPHTHPFDMTGHPMAGWVMIGPEGCENETEFNHWVKQGIAFASSLPKKEK